MKEIQVYLRQVVLQITEAESTLNIHSQIIPNKQTLHAKKVSLAAFKHLNNITPQFYYMIV